LWWNDPDVVVLTGDLSEDEFRFHASAIYASEGMLLSGDDLTRISAQKLEMLRTLQPPVGVAARFTAESLRVGVTELPDRHVVCLLNREDTPQTISFKLPRAGRITDFWSGESLGWREGTFTIKEMAARSWCVDKAGMCDDRLNS
jgi:alpha-galactosidase